MQRFGLTYRLIVWIGALLFGCTIESGVMGQETSRFGESEHYQSQQLIVGTFNIRYNNREDGEDAWPNRKQFVAKVISDEKADIVGLQEALREQVDDLESLLPAYAWFGVGRDDGETAGEHVPIFYRRDRFEVVDKGHFWLSEEPNEPGSRSWDAAITRMVSWMILKDNRSGKELLFANTHFDHRGEVARRESASLIRKRLPELSAQRPVILTGDFNCLDSGEPYQILIGKSPTKDSFLLDARSVCSAKPIGPNSTWSGFREVVPDRRIDFVFVTEDLPVVRHKVVDRTFDGRFPSDHLPVFAAIKFATEKD